MTSKSQPVLALLGEEWGAISELGGTFSEDDWSLPTECPGWNVRDLVSHMVGTERSLLGDEAPPPADPEPPYVRNPLGASNEAWVQARRGLPGSVVLSEFDEVTQRRLEQMENWEDSRFEAVVPSPVGEVPYRDFLSVRVMDCWVHEQDMRVATARHGHLAGGAGELSIRRLVSGLGFVVAKQAGAPDGSLVRFDIRGEVPRSVEVNVNGRRGVLEEPSERPATATLRMDAQTFRRLTCGRLAGDNAVDAGLVEIEGDSALARRVASAMGFMV